ncbi:MAG: M42 family metallopeptidase [archaeon]|nr:MAG: M42 family metallopeptidase [archaeon]
MGVKILLKKFVDVSGISGSEDNVRNLMKKELRGHVNKVYEDRVGNLISVKGNGKLKILLTAHMDEIGFIVKHINDKGFLKLNPLGGWDPKILLSQRVRIHTDKGTVNGVIGSKAIHMQEKEELEKAPKLKQLFVDIGADSKEDAEKMVKIGDYAEITGEFSELGSNRTAGRCFDNRISCVVLTEVMRRVKPKGSTLYGVGSVQEELGLKGATAAMFGVDPDVIISLDVGLAADPYTEDGEVSNKLGEGAIIEIQEYAFVVHKKVKKLLVETAKKNKIPYQLGVSSGGASEATKAILTREGKPGGLVGVPVRYMHSTVETADLKDIESAISLVTRAVENAGNYF